MASQPKSACSLCDPYLLGHLKTNRRVALYEPCEQCLVDCSACDGVGFMFERDDEGYELSLRCRECGPQRLALERFNRAGILSDFAKADFDQIDTSARDTNLGQVVGQVKRWSQRFVPGVKGFCLVGGVGTGKTHLLTSTVRRAVLLKATSARYVDFSILLNDLKQCYDEDRPTTPIIKPLVETSLLAIDELGKGRKSEWELTIIDQLINERYSRGMTTIFATNFDTEDETTSRGRQQNFSHDSLAAQMRERLELRVGGPLFSRVSAMAFSMRALAGLARCERPSHASSRTWGDQPGRLAVGPEEKRGSTGRVTGCSSRVIAATLPDRRPSVGRGGPIRQVAECAGNRKRHKDSRGATLQVCAGQGGTMQERADPSGRFLTQCRSRHVLGGEG